MAVAFLCVFGCSIGWPVTFNAFLLVLYWSTNDFLFCFTIIYWPPWTWALTNVHIKPHSCLPPDTITSIFKGFLARATKICSEKYLRVEIEYLIYFAKMDMIEKHCKRWLIALKRKHVVPTIVITTPTKSKQLPFLGYQKSDQKSKKKCNSLDLQ